jgi:hypothetical protein
MSQYTVETGMENMLMLLWFKIELIGDARLLAEKNSILG